MKRKIVKYCLFIFIFSLTMVVGIGTCFALSKTGQKGTTINKNDFYFHRYDTGRNGAGDIGARTALVYKVKVTNGKDKGKVIDTYCMDNGSHYGGGGFTSVDALTFLKQYRAWNWTYGNGYGRSAPLGDKAQEYLTKIAIYNEYFMNRSNITGKKAYEKKRLFSQITLWEILRDPYKWQAAHYFSFYDTYKGKKDWGEEYKSHKAKADQFYETNKNNYKGIGVVWYRVTNGVVDDYNKQPLIEVDVDPIVKYDYSLDIACENCESTLPNKKAYVIQDTPNWEAIKHSTNQNFNDNVKNYFYRGNGIYCREEYHVYLPNKTSEISVQLARYFTLNGKPSDLEIIPNDIRDFNPVKVTKIRECVGSDANLTNFENRSKADYTKDCSAGTIRVYYSDNTYTYNKGCEADKTLVVDLNADTRNNNAYSKQIRDGKLTQVVTHYYTLPENLYRYVRKEDNLSLETKPSDDVAVEDLKVSNFPIASSNTYPDTNDEVRVGEVRFSYTLPSSSCDSFSKIKVAYDNPNYLVDGIPKIENIYSKIKNRKALDSGDRADSTACWKLYKSESGTNDIDGYNACVNARTSDKAATCRSKIDNTNKNKCGPDNGSYKCLIMGYETGKPPVCDRDTAGTDLFPDYDWDPITQKCCKKSECPPTVCNKNNVGKAPYENYEWDDVNKTCCEKGRCPSDDKCKLKCEGKGVNEKGESACCPDNTCGEWDGDEVICSGKPPFYTAPVYRTIDIEHPFTSKSGGDRATGDNWCDGKDCSSGDDTTNRLVTKYIKNSNTTDESNAMYIVDLSAEDIDAVRNYNTQHTYDDFTLKCSQYGENCVMKDDNSGFFNVVRIEGKCGTNHSLATFDTCAK